MGQNVIDIDDNLRLVGTAHVSSASVALVREQIDEYAPDLIAVELCESRLKSLKRPDDLANSDLLNIINEGRSSMILLQSALAAQQRRMGIETGEKPGAELLAAIEAADAAEIPHELIDRDVVITLRRAWRKMGLREKWRVLNALLWDEDDDEVVDFDEMLEDTDLLSAMMEEAKAVAPRAGEVLIDERDAYLAGRIQQIRGKGRILAVVGAGHLSGIVDNLQKPPQETTSNLANLREEPPKPRWPKVIMWAIPLFLASVVGWLVYNGDRCTEGNAVVLVGGQRSPSRNRSRAGSRTPTLDPRRRSRLPNHQSQPNSGGRLVRRLYPVEGRSADWKRRSRIPRAAGFGRLLEQSGR